MNKHVARQPVLEHVLIEGEHTILRPVNAGDAKAGFEMIHDRREVLDWLVWQGPETIEELSNAYSRWITPGETGYNYHLAVTERASGDFCGTIGLRYVDHPFVCDLGYWLGEPFWNRGIGTEAVSLACHLGFRHLASTLVTAEVFVGNEASCRVLEKSGFRRGQAPKMRPIETQVEGRTTQTGREEWLFTLDRSSFDACSADRQPHRESVRLAQSEV